MHICNSYDIFFHPVFIATHHVPGTALGKGQHGGTRQKLVQILLRKTTEESENLIVRIIMANIS